MNFNMGERQDLRFFSMSNIFFVKRAITEKESDGQSWHDNMQRIFPCFVISSHVENWYCKVFFFPKNVQFMILVLLIFSIRVRMQRGHVSKSGEEKRREKAKRFQMCVKEKEVINRWSKENQCNERVSKKCTRGKGGTSATKEWCWWDRSHYWYWRRNRNSVISWIRRRFRRVKKGTTRVQKDQSSKWQGGKRNMKKLRINLMIHRLVVHRKERSKSKRSKSGINSQRKKSLSERHELVRYEDGDKNISMGRWYDFRKKITKNKRTMSRKRSVPTEDSIFEFLVTNKHAKCQYKDQYYKKKDRLL